MLNIDRSAGVPVYEQVIQQLKRLILIGVYPPGAPLPSVRTLSQQLELNPNTLQKAFTEMEARGLCFSVAGTGRFVAEDAKQHLREEAGPLLEQLDLICAQLLLLGFDRNALSTRLLSMAGAKEEIDHD